MILPNSIWSVGDLANVIRDARQTRSMTQSELAHRAHVSRPWISQFEKGKIPNPTLDRILRICDILDVRLEAGYGPSFASDKMEPQTIATDSSNTRTSLPLPAAYKAYASELSDSFSAIGQSYQKELQQLKESIAKSTKTLNAISSLPQHALLDVNDAAVTKEA